MSTEHDPAIDDEVRSQLADAKPDRVHLRVLAACTLLLLAIVYRYMLS